MKKLLFLLFSLLVTVACEKALPPIDDPTDPVDPSVTTYNVTGAIQKGPFTQGTSITIQELDDNFAPTGKSYQTQTIDDAGAFKLDSKITTKYVEIIAEGYYFNEVDGKISSSQLTLRTISDLSVSGKTNINVLTSIANEKVKTLILNEKLSFEDALSQTEREVLNAFNMPESSDDMQFDKLDITQAGKLNAMLLAISVTLQSDRSVGEMSELISKISSEINEFGEIQNTSIKEQIQTGAVGIDSKDVRANLVTRYEELGIECEVPDFENYIDSDGNGKIDSNEAWLLVKGEKTYNINFTMQEIDIEIEQNIDYEISISYSDETAEPWINYEKIETKADIVRDNIRFYVAESFSPDDRIATITFQNPNDENQKSEIVVVQNPEGAIVLGENAYILNATDLIFELNFDTNIKEFAIEITPATVDWFKPAPVTKGTMESYVRNFVLEQNTSSEDRVVTLIITADDVTPEEVVITQLGQSILEANPAYINVSHKGQKSRFTVTHNGDYTIDWSNLQLDWSYKLIEEGEMEDIYEINFPERKSWDYHPLLSTITISQNKGSKIIDYEIFQSPSSKVDFDVVFWAEPISNKAQVIDFKVGTNVGLVPIIDVDWITITTDAKSDIIVASLPEVLPPPDANLTEYNYRFNIKANNENGNRTGVVTFKTIYGDHANYSGNPVTLTIEQRGEDMSLVVDDLTLGDLANRLSENDRNSATSLTISGALSHSDIKDVIVTMPNLYELNISKVGLENNTLPSNAFPYETSRCIKRLTLPDNNYIMEKDALSYLKLKYINFGGVEIITSSGDGQILEEVIFNSVKEIGNRAFSQLTKMTNLNFPATLEKIESGAFSFPHSEYNNIESITFADGCKITELGEVFNGFEKLTSINIPETVVTMNSTFAGCRSLKTIKLPSALRYIDILNIDNYEYQSPNGAFAGTSIEIIEIPASVEIIGTGTFLNCTSLRKITFAENSKLKKIKSKSAFTRFPNRFVPCGSFKSCTALEEITIPASVEEMSGAVFYGCTNLKKVVFAPNSMLKTVVGASAGYTDGLNRFSDYTGLFEGCGIESIVLPEGLITIGDYAFMNSGNVQITAPGVVTLGTLAFAGTPIKTFDFPNLTTIGDYAFENSTSLGSISFPKVTIIGEGVFKNCSKLTEVLLPEVMNVKQDAFGNCTSLRSISLPKATIIGIMAFKGCSSLRTLSLPLLNQIRTDALAGTALTTLEIATAQNTQLKGMSYSQSGESATLFGDTSNTSLTIGNNYVDYISVDTNTKTLTVKYDNYTFKNITVVNNK